MKKINKKQIILLIILIILALIPRLILAPQPGYKDDTDCWQRWSYLIQKRGLTNIYEEYKTPGIFIDPNYLPPYLYILGLLGKIYQKFFSPQFLLDTKILYLLLKLPAIIFDLFLGLLIFFFLLPREKFKTAYLISALFLLNPAIIYDSSYWGQIDSIHTFFILLALILLYKNKFSFSWIFITLASFFKLQSTILIPFFLIINYKKQEAKKTIINLFIALLTAGLICLPFLVKGKISYLLKIIFTAPGSYPVLSANAFNFWWLLHGIHFSSRSFFLIRDISSSSPDLFSPFFIGLIIFLAVYFLTLLNYHLKKYPSAIFFSTAAFLIFSFFMIPTEMHERYLYPVLPLICLTLFQNKKMWLIYIGLSFTLLANLLAVLPFLDLTKKIFNCSSPSSWPIVFLNIFLYFSFFIYLIKYNKNDGKNSYRSSNL